MCIRDNYITLTGTAPVNVKWLQINGVTYDVNWTSVTQWSVTVVLQPGVNNLVVQGLDLNGQPIGSAFDSIRVTFTGTAELAEQSLVINEIMYHPADANAEFVEIYNCSLTSAFSLAGYRLEGVAFSFPSSAVILPDGFVVIAQDPLA